MSRSFLAAAAFLIALVFISAAIAADPAPQGAKFAQVSVQKIYKDSARIKAAREEMKKIEAETVPRLSVLKTEAEKIAERLSSGKDSLKADERDKLEKDYTAKRDEAEALQQALRAKLSLKQRSAQNAVTGDMEEIVAKVAKDEGFEAVFINEYLLYSGGMADITDRVLKELDAKPAVEGTPK